MAGLCCSKKKPKIADKILSQKIRQLVPESQAYMDLLAFERKLDATIARKRLDIQEALKRPMRVGYIPLPLGRFPSADVGLSKMAVENCLLIINLKFQPGQLTEQ